MSPTERGLARILVALDASASGRAALAGAAALAAELQAELLGLFVEDANLLRLASLPFSARSAWGPAAEEARNEETMARALRAEAALLRELLAREAERLHLRWSFRVTRGTVARELVEAAERVDLVVMGSAGRNPAVGGNLGSTARAVAPLKPAADALLLDTTHMDIESAVQAGQAELDQLTQRIIAAGLASWSGGETDDRQLPRPTAGDCAAAGCHDGKAAFSTTRTRRAAARRGSMPPTGAG